MLQYTDPTSNVIIDPLFTSVNDGIKTPPRRGKGPDPVFELYARRLDGIRFFAICSIVWGHSVFSWENRVFTNQSDQLIQSLVLQVGHVGTIFFFLISGYFLSDRLAGFTIISYLKYRLYTVIIPWFIFLSLYVIIQTCHATSADQFLTGNWLPIVKTMVSLYQVFIFHAAFWFVPVSIISALILIALKDQLDSKWAAIIFIGITVFYGINLYFSWIPPIHTKAFLGYTMFMWIGLQFKTHYNLIQVIFDKFLSRYFILALGALFLLSCYEGKQLRILGCPDPYASLRISNGVFSLILFFKMLRSEKVNMKPRFKLQNYVYGVYLIHCILITECAPYLARLVTRLHLFSDMPDLLLLQIVFFGFIMCLSLIAVRLIKESPIRSIIGTKKKPKLYPSYAPK